MLGTKILDVYPHVETNNDLVRSTDKHHLCTYCLMNGRNKKTRWKCAHRSCGLPLC